MLKKKKIAIDARFYGPKNKGLGRYCQKTVDYLEQIEGDNPEIDYYILLRKENFDLYQPQAANFKKVLADFPWYSFKEQLGFLFFLNKFNFDLVHFCHFNVPLLYRGEFVVTIHDLILLHYPTVRNTTLNRFFYFIKLFAYRWVIKSTTKRAQRVIAVSKYTQQDIVRNLKVPPEKIDMIYEGVDFHCFVSFEKSEAILKKYAIIKNEYLLYVGNAYPHKNLERLVLAYKRVRAKNPRLKLVLVGKKDYFYERLERFIHKNKIKDVVLAGYVSDQELDVLYQHTRLYVFPSLYEGFGLPPLEALMRRAPVVSSDRTCMPEVLGGMVSYFNPKDVQSIADGIESALVENKTIADAETVAIIKKFNWEKAAERISRVYQKALS